MDVEASLDENFLFSNFQEPLTGKAGKSKKSKKRKLIDLISGENGEQSVNIPEEIALLIEQKDKYIQQLEEQNNKLKAVIKRLCGPQDLSDEGSLWQNGSLEAMPMAVVLFLNNELSLSCRKDVEDSLSELTKKDLKSDDTLEIQNLKVQPSAVPLRAFAVDTKGKRVHKAKAISETSEPHVFSSVQYFFQFCLDRTGLPLLENNPAITQLWSIPIYEQVFLNALPLVTDGQKILIKPRKSMCCFNCLGDHNVSQCDQPRDYARINSNRGDFINKFGSPGGDARYHQGDSDRFRDFKPGQVSSALREALGINENELPPYIYKMRSLGYPPGYLKSNESGLIMYDKEGKIQEKNDSEEGEIDSFSFPRDISYEGFNAPLSEGTIDRSFEYGMPSFDETRSPNASGSYQQDDSIRSSSTPLQNRQNRYDQQHRRFEEEPQDDMDLDDAVAYSDLTSVQEKLSLSLRSSSINDSSDERPPLPLPQSTPEHPPPPPGETDFALSLNSIEIGELLEKAEIRAKKSKIVDTYLAQGQAESSAQYQSGSSHRQWWLQEPISSTAGILYFTYTPPPTIKGEVKVENVIHSTILDLDREPWKTDSTSWYDPLYGDLAAPTGIYDSIKEILKKRKKRRQLKKVC